MLIDFIVLAVGTALLLGGAWVLLRGATTIAVAFGVSPVIIGATVVAFGTSAPELVVTVAAGLRGAAGVAFGNVVGSNIANVFLVLGMAALISPISVHRRLIRWEIPILLVATVTTLGFAVGGGLSTVAGGVMLAGLAGFVILSPMLFPEIGDEVAEEVTTPVAKPARRHILYSVAFVLVGLAGLGVAAELVVRSASSLAEGFGVSEFVIGVVVVAVGTSLPEVVTSAMAALKNEHDLAVGNVVGSNIFNLLAVAGAGAVVSGIPVGRALFEFELPLMLVSSLILVPLVWPRYHIGRFAGSALLAGYAGAVLATVLRGA